MNGREGLYDAAAAPAPTSHRACAVPRDPRAAPLHVLLVEDNATNQLLARRLLLKQGHTVLVVESGRAAIEAIAGQRFDVVLMDVQMPEMTGLEATAIIRGSEAGTGRHLPIVAVTAHAMKSDVEACFASGMDAYISKPIRTAELFETIDRVTSGRTAQKAAGDEGPMAALPVIDRKALLEGTDGDAALMRVLLAVFPREVPGLVAAVTEAVARRDASALSNAAQRVKGAFGNFRATRVIEVAVQLESMGRAGNVAAAEVLLSVLEREVRRVGEELARLSS